MAEWVSVPDGEAIQWDDSDWTLGLIQSRDVGVHTVLNIIKGGYELQLPGGEVVPEGAWLKLRSDGTLTSAQSIDA